jgi:hypothetical protein
VTWRHDWRSLGGCELRELDDGIDLLQLSRGKGVREGRLIKVKRIEERRETGTHQRWQISPEMLAVAMETDDELRQLKGGFREREEKETREGFEGYLGVARGRNGQGVKRIKEGN